MHSWRHFSYYFFGLLPSVFFSLRFFIQWLQSEKQKKSVVTKSFWHFSLCGNVLLSIHYFFQLQLFFFMLQIINGFISWRNLNLLSRQKYKLKSTLILFFAILVIATALFFSQNITTPFSLRLLDIPAGKPILIEVSLWWHLLGMLGTFLFASRFWIQWVLVEKSQTVDLGRSFWLTSIIGSFAALIYFLHISDWISVLNYSAGLIPYIRNLFLIKNLNSHTKKI